MNSTQTTMCDWKPYQSDLQQQIEELSLKCGIPSSENIKSTLMVPNGAFLNMPLNRSMEQYKDLKKCKNPNSRKTKVKCFEDKKQAFDKVVERHIIPGYTYRRTSDRIQIILSDEFWSTSQSNHKDQNAEDAQQEDNIVDQEVVLNLERMVAQLKLELQDVKLDHKETIENMRNEHSFLLSKKDENHQESIKILEEMRQEKLSRVKSEHNTYVEELRSEQSREKAKLKDEIEFLKKQFERHKEFVDEELDRKWTDRQDELQHEMEEKTQNLLNEQRSQLEKEKSIAIDQMTTLNNKQMTSMMETHQHEMEKLLQKFKDIAREGEKLKQAMAEISTLREENECLKTEISESKDKLRKTENELSDVRVKLTSFEKGFTEKVAEVEERFSAQIERLTLENFELRKKYLRKCEELHEVSSQKEERQNDMLIEAKDLMQSVILSRTRANVSLSYSETPPPSPYEEKVANKFLTRHKSPTNHRPLSAPTTSKEGEHARHWKTGPEDHHKTIPKSKSFNNSLYQERRLSCRSANIRLPRIRRQHGEERRSSSDIQQQINSLTSRSSSSLEVPKVNFSS